MEHWIELFETYEKIYETKVNSLNIKKYIAKDPVIFLRHFHRKLSHLIKDVIYSKEKPIGNVIHHYIRIEYQQIGNSIYLIKATFYYKKFI